VLCAGARAEHEARAAASAELEARTRPKVGSLYHMDGLRSQLDDETGAAHPRLPYRSPRSASRSPPRPPPVAPPLSPPVGPRSSSFAPPLGDVRAALPPRSPPPRSPPLEASLFQQTRNGGPRGAAVAAAEHERFEVRERKRVTAEREVARLEAGAMAAAYVAAAAEAKLDEAEAMSSHAHAEAEALRQRLAATYIRPHTRLPPCTRSSHGLLTDFCAVSAQHSVGLTIAAPVDAAAHTLCWGVLLQCSRISH
jgi:hypothetical protein